MQNPGRTSPRRIRRRGFCASRTQYQPSRHDPYVWIAVRSKSEPDHSSTSGADAGHTSPHVGEAFLSEGTDTIRAPTPAATPRNDEAGLHLPSPPLDPFTLDGSHQM